MSKKIVLTVAFLLVIVLGLHTESSIHSQTTEQACETIVTEALQVVGSACAQMGNSEACYGYNQVAATFRGTDITPTFSARGDLVNLVDLEALFTLPADPLTGTWGVALMTVTADLPTQGAPMTFVLLGDTQVTDTDPSANAVSCAVRNNNDYNINIRSGPGTNNSIVGVFSQNTSGTVTGRNSAGDWIFIDYGGVEGWISAPLVTIDCPLDSLLVTDGTTSGGVPMQAITLRTGAAGECDTAPNGLLVRSPSGQRATIYVNGVEMSFSSAAFVSARPNSVMAVDGLEGTVDLKYGDDEVQVQAGFSSLVPLTDLEASGPPSPPQPTDPSFGVILPTLDQLTTTLQENRIGADACVAVANGIANTRSGPGTVYALRDSLNEGDGARVEAQAEGLDGFQWWKLSTENWVRSDVVDVTGNCDQLPVVVNLPPTPTPVPYTATPTPSPTSEPERYIEVTACYDGGGVFSEVITANRSMRAGCFYGFVSNPEEASYWNMALRVDGALIPSSFVLHESGRYLWQGRTTLSPGQHTFTCELTGTGGYGGEYYYSSCTVTAQ